MNDSVLCFFSGAAAVGGEDDGHTESKSVIEIKHKNETKNWWIVCAQHSSHIPRSMSVCATKIQCNQKSKVKRNKAAAVAQPANGKNCVEKLFNFYLWMAQSSRKRIAKSRWLQLWRYIAGIWWLCCFSLEKCLRRLSVPQSHNSRFESWCFGINCLALLPNRHFSIFSSIASQFLTMMSTLNDCCIIDSVRSFGFRRLYLLFCTRPFGVCFRWNSIGLPNTQSRIQIICYLWIDADASISRISHRVVIVCPLLKAEYTTSYFSLMKWSSQRRRFSWWQYIASTVSFVVFFLFISVMPSSLWSCFSEWDNIIRYNASAYTYRRRMCTVVMIKKRKFIFQTNDQSSRCFSVPLSLDNTYDASLTFWNWTMNSS